jgi:RND family efflux transporter MFP subunit
MIRNPLSIVILLLATAASTASTNDDSRLDCYISPFLTANVGSEVPGIIAETLVERGDRVEKGEVIARLESRVEQATLDLRQARVEYLSRDFERKKKLFTDGIVSSQEFDEAETNLKMAERELEEARQIVERRIIRSPLQGVVVERYLCPGERVEEKPIFKLAQIDPLNVEIIAPASQLGRVKLGDRAMISPERPMNKEYAGRVTIVDPVVDAASGTFGIRVELKNPNFAIPSGLKCQARFPSSVPPSSKSAKPPKSNLPKN